MKLSTTIKTIALIIGISFSIFAINLVVLAWTGPSQEPPGCPAGEPGCDVPLHEGTEGQIKDGPLGIEGVLRAYSNLIVDGNVGIGTTSPGAKLDVAGTVRMTGFQLGTSATAGHVLTTNASGVGAWQAAPSAPVSSVFGRTGAVTAQVGDYSAHYVNKTGDTITGKIYPASTNNRQAGMYGIYDSYRIGHIWSMGTAYQIPEDGSNFGNLYGLAYKHTNNPTGGAMAGGHQMVWAQNGVPRVALGTNIWTSGSLTVGSTGSFSGAVTVATPTASNHAATKAYVDAQAGGGSSCPSEIESSDRSAATLVNAITTCRNRGGDWRLPTAEEISCFIGASGVSSSSLWTRSPYYGGYSYWVRVRLTDGGWGNDDYNNTHPFRCVR